MEGSSEELTNDDRSAFKAQHTVAWQVDCRMRVVETMLDSEGEEEKTVAGKIKVMPASVSRHPTPSTEKKEETATYYEW